MEIVFFGSFRRSTGLPYDCADVHVRRILLKGICNNHEFFFNLFKCSIAQTYGHDRDTEGELQRKIEAGEISPQDLREQRLPGPFSFLAWLRYMSRNSSYAGHSHHDGNLHDVEHQADLTVCRVPEGSKVQAP